jgi:Uma2 family endonuclease
MLRAAEEAVANPVVQGMTVDEFFAWQERQPERCELVNGQPLRKIVGAENVHDDIVVNLIGELGMQLRSGSCRPFTADGSIQTRPGQIRRPDAGVDCGSRDPNGYTAARPKMIAEVLSPSTRDFDTFGKLDEYKGLESVEYIVLVEPNEPLALVWSRDGAGGWTEARARGLDARVEMPAIGVSLELAAIYEGVEFPVRPRLVSTADEEAER